MFYRNNRQGSSARPNNRFSGGPRRFSSRPPARGLHHSKYIKKAGPTTQEITPFVPKFAFADLPIDTVLKQNILKKGYAHPTPIQDGTVMPILEGKDVVGIANTGTGKTAAFLVPLLHKTVKNRDERVLIVVPTRELATQIRDEMRSLSYGMNVYSVLCIGGAFIRTQIYELRRSPNFVIGTPGRIKDLIERKTLDISRFNTIILDEVDRMLDMGFIQDIRYLVSLLPKQRQSLFFSATLSPEIRTLINSFTSEPVMISVKTQDTTEMVDQDVVKVSGPGKMEMLEKLLNQEDFKKVLIFGRTKMGVERISTSLYQKGFKVASIHGDKPQAKRNQAIRLFKENVVSILVATDVASRGIDIADITHVINYDQPATYEDYVHRIGRTGRANKKGVALTFVE